MVEPLTAMTPSHMNRVLPNLSHSKMDSGSHEENRPYDSPQGPPSSPFVSDIGVSPSKLYTPAHSRTPAREEQRPWGRTPLTESTLRKKDNLAYRSRSIDESRIDPSIRSPRTDEEATSAIGFMGMDDTCYSAFSAIPNADMTRFANLASSPSKADEMSQQSYSLQNDCTPRAVSQLNADNQTYTHTTSRVRRDQHNYEEETINLLMDYSDRTIRQSPTKMLVDPALHYGVTSRRTVSPHKAAHTATPRQLTNLLDFDMPPAPSPRSLPTITARELETMKSNLLSQISDLTASLTGRDAEVKVLKQAVTDAESRVVTAMEELGHERAEKLVLRKHRDDLEKRQTEMQKVLKDVKQEIIEGDRERDTLNQRMVDLQQKYEQAQTRAINAEDKLATLPAPPTPSAVATANPDTQVEAAVTRVAQELHTLYKQKHETKVTALKKSYSDRWEKKVRALEARVDELTRENDELRLGRDATMSGLVPGTLIPDSTIEQHKARLESQQAQLQRSEEALVLVNNDLLGVRTGLAAKEAENETLKHQLEASRIEVDELIAATEELMHLSQTALATSEGDFPGDDASTDRTSSAAGRSVDIKCSLSRSLSGASGSRLPGPGVTTSTGAGESGIGRVVGSQTGGHPRERSGSGLGSRSGIMSNIERMGRGRITTD